jgi:hypothetical protein
LWPEFRAWGFAEHNLRAFFEELDAIAPTEHIDPRCTWSLSTDLGFWKYAAGSAADTILANELSWLECADGFCRKLTPTTLSVSMLVKGANEETLKYAAMQSLTSGMLSFELKLIRPFIDDHLARELAIDQFAEGGALFLTLQEFGLQRMPKK